jgi:hypothetical protein
MKNERKSISLRWLKNQLREEAIKEEDEERKKKLWRWYFKAEDAEYEVDILVLKAEVRRLLELAVEYGLLDKEVLKLDIGDDEEDEESLPPKPKKRKSRKKPPPEDENLPKQKTLWDETP